MHPLSEKNSSLGHLDLEAQAQSLTNRIESILAFRSLEQLANEIRYSCLPESISLEGAAQRCANWTGFTTIENHEFTISLLAEMSPRLSILIDTICSVDSVYRIHQKKIDCVSEKIKVFEQDERIQAVRQYQETELKKPSASELPETGNKNIEQLLQNLIDEEGKPALEKFQEKVTEYQLEKRFESIEDAIAYIYRKLPFSEKNDFDFARPIIGGNPGGFLLALSEAVKGKAISRTFMEKNIGFISKSLLYSGIMDRNDFLSLDQGAPKEIDLPSPYSYLLNCVIQLKEG